MSNRLFRVQVRDRSPDPAQAELWVVAETEHVTPTMELRGRLMGPRCFYSATVEVAYPLRPFARRPDSLSGPAARVVIPEPSLWEPECPFVYEGMVELWEDRACVDQVAIRHGIRRILLGRGGLRVNGRALSLRGRSLAGCDDDEATALRRDGCNLLVAPAEADVWERADRRGFFVLGRLREPHGPTLTLAQRLTAHPSCLGWLLEPPFDPRAGAPIGRLRERGALVGQFCDEAPDGPALEGIGFVALPAGGRAPGLPSLLRGAGPDFPGTFGRVD
jgi:hypothetical protein